MSSTVQGQLKLICKNKEVSRDHQTNPSITKLTYLLTMSIKTIIRNFKFYCNYKIHLSCRMSGNVIILSRLV